MPKIHTTEATVEHLAWFWNAAEWNNADSCESMCGFVPYSLPPPPGPPTATEQTQRFHEPGLEKPLTLLHEG